VRWVAASDLRCESKWTRFPIADIREAATGPTLKDFFRIKRGLVTGDNRFFILTPEQIVARNLPWQYFTPILPSPRHLESDEILADGIGSPAIKKRLFLLDCRLPEPYVQQHSPELWRYLQTGKPDVSNRYLCRKRTPWYSQEERPPATFMCTYIGRSDNQNRKPFRFILNHSNARAANVYLLLYPKPGLSGALEADPSLARRVWEVLCAIPPEDLLGEGRVYGGGLHKLEPNELANVPARAVQALLHATLGQEMRQTLMFGVDA
jgi:adenine-specific DNA-methyltransferase